MTILIILVAIAFNQIGLRGINMLDYKLIINIGRVILLVFMLIISYYLGKMIQIGFNKARGTKIDNNLSSKVLFTLIGFVIVVIIIELFDREWKNMNK